MARSIKGITIEIAGNTSGLVKAMNEANKSIRETEKELRQVNKALKLDPGNADLIKAKQNALAREIEATKEKLDAEKKAAEGAAEALEKGTITQGEYDALQADIALTTNKLKDLEKQGFVEVENELDGTYKVTSAFHYIEEMIDCLTIYETEDEQ